MNCDAMNRRIEIPQNAKQILDVLENAGFEAYVVGGCVRDCILGRIPNDWDITTSAKPEQVKSLFRRTIDTGIQHGTVTVMIGAEGYEVTTYRIDGEYMDGRHPSAVTFTPDLKEDLLRRDFTINAMAYSDKRGLVDLYGGLEDIDKKMIRCVGDPMARFGEDALRMMRAIRFSAQLGYEIEEETRKAIVALAGNLAKVSSERIQIELVKTVESAHPDYVRQFYETGLSAVFLPEFDRAMQTPQVHKHHCYDVGEHLLHSMLEILPKKHLRLAMLLHDIGKPDTLTIDEDGVTHFHGHPGVGEKMTKEILKRLKFDNNTIDTVSKLVFYHDYGTGVVPDQKIIRRALSKMGMEIFPMFLLVKRADILAQSTYMREEKLQNLKEWEEVYEQVQAKGECVSLKQLAVNGGDLISLGMKPGKEMGEALQMLLSIVIDEPEKNDKEILLDILRQHQILE